DLRRLRWSILGWCALVMARMLISTAGADIALGGFGPQIGIGELSALLPLTDVLFLALLISRLVHDEPLVWRDAFWMTRPIAPDALMAAKLWFALCFFLVVPLAGDAVVAAAFGTGAADIARTIPVFLVNQGIRVMLLMALAAVTPSLVRYVLAVVGVAAAFVMLMASMVLVALWTTEEISEGGGARGRPGSRRLTGRQPAARRRRVHIPAPQVTQRGDCRACDRHRRASRIQRPRCCGPIAIGAAGRRGAADGRRYAECQAGGIRRWISGGPGNERRSGARRRSAAKQEQRDGRSFLGTVADPAGAGGAGFRAAPRRARPAA